jgi:DNA-directed RNA polymerase subunit RPC12/RpoP
MNKELVQALEKLIVNMKNGAKLSYREEKVIEAAQSHDCWYECKKCKRIINGFGNNLVEQYQGTNKLHCAACGFHRDE